MDDASVVGVAPIDRRAVGAQHGLAIQAMADRLIKRIEWLVDHHLRDAFASMCDVIERGQAASRVLPGEPGRIYYAIIGLTGTLLSVSTEFRQLTGRDVFTEPEIQRTIAFVEAFLFIA